MDKTTITLCNDFVKDITGAVTSSGDHISASIAALSLNFSTEMAVAVTLIGAISASLTAFLFNYIHEGISLKRRRRSELAKLIDKLVTDLESIATKYWSSEYTAELDSDSVVAETTMKSTLKYLDANIKMFLGSSSNRKKEDVSKLENFCFDMFDLVTGDGFESISRKPSKEKVVKISSKCTEARTILCRAMS